MTEVFFHPEADREFISLEKEKQEVIHSEVEMFKKNGLSYRNFGIVENKEIESKFYRLKVKKEKPIEINQRLLMAPFYNRWVVYGVKHRENAYRKEVLESLENRRYTSGGSNNE